jgi:hypothetical protein
MISKPAIIVKITSITRELLNVSNKLYVKKWRYLTDFLQCIIRPYGRLLEIRSYENNVQNYDFSKYNVFSTHTFHIRYAILTCNRHVVLYMRYEKHT